MDINIVWIIAVLLLAAGKYIECPYGTHTSCGYQIVAQDHQTVT